MYYMVLCAEWSLNRHSRNSEKMPDTQYFLKKCFILVSEIENLALKPRLEDSGRIGGVWFSLIISLLPV